MAAKFNLFHSKQWNIIQRRSAEIIGGSNQNCFFRQLNKSSDVNLKFSVVKSYIILDLCNGFLPTPTQPMCCCWLGCSFRFIIRNVCSCLTRVKTAAYTDGKYATLSRSTSYQQPTQKFFVSKIYFKYCSEEILSLIVENSSKSLEF